MDKMGRPPAIKPDQKATFEALMGIPFVTSEHICAVFGCSPKTLQRWVKETYEQTFDQLRKQKRKGMYLKLAGKQYEVAMKGNVSMLIWLGKQWLDQSDKYQETGEKKPVTFKLKYE